jgi:hypothetical protein
MLDGAIEVWNGTAVDDMTYADEVTAFSNLK